MRIPLYIICCFSLTAFKILSLSLTFDNMSRFEFLDSSSLELSGFIQFLSFPRLGKFSAINFSYKLSACFSPLISFWDPCNTNFGLHDHVPKSLKQSSFFLFLSFLLL